MDRLFACFSYRDGTVSGARGPLPGLGPDPMRFDRGEWARNPVNLHQNRLDNTPGHATINGPGCYFYSGR